MNREQFAALSPAAKYAAHLSDWQGRRRDRRSYRNIGGTRDSHPISVDHAAVRRRLRQRSAR